MSDGGAHDVAATRAHEPVLLQSTIAALALAPDDVVLDCTFGRGGHSRAILSKLGPCGRVFALDRDPEAVAHGQQLRREDARLVIAHSAFSDLEAALDELGVAHVNAVLFDLGVSSPQLDDGDRGFSFVRNGPLDMRMDPSRGPSAQEWLAQVTLRDLTLTLKNLGEERFARRIASAIVRARTETAITTTSELADIVAAAIPKREVNKHPATRSFQAIRMAVNDELGQLRAGLDAALARLAAGGRLAAISFHSLEDRIVKHFMREHHRGPELPRGLPAPADWPRPALASVAKSVKADAAEVALNPRARSAILRVCRKHPS